MVCKGLHFSPWMSVGLQFSDCSDVFLYSLSKFTKFHSNFDTMSILVNQLTVAQAHQEFTTLVDKISAKFEELDSGEIRAVGTPAFDGKIHELAVKFACMHQLCQWLNIPVPAHLHRPPFFKHEVV